MNRFRRRLLRAASGAAVLAWGLTRPLAVRGAEEWNERAFGAKNVGEALQAAGLALATATQEVEIKAPEIAENGAQVPVEILSKLPGTDVLHVFVDKNPQPYVGSFHFMQGAEPFLSTRIKMGETSNIRVVARAGGKYYIVTKEVKVTIGGCGT